MSDHKKLSKKELLKVIKKLENNPDDKAKILGEIGITVLGAGAVGTAVAAFGVSTSIPLITSLTGIALVGATPIGWVAGAAIAGGSVAYGLAQFLKSGSYSEGQKRELLKKLKEQLKDIEVKERSSTITSADMSNFYGLLGQALDSNLINEEDAQMLLRSIANGQMKLSEAFGHIQAIIASAN